MPLDLQAGAPSEALRKAFGLRGRFGMQVDETISPVAAVRDLTAAPFRSDGFGVILSQTSPLLAANFSSVQFANDGAVNSIYPVVIDSMFLWNPQAVATTYQFGYKVSSLGPAKRAVTFEPARPGATFSLTDLVSQTLLTVAPTQQGGTAIVFLQGEVTLPAGGSIVLPLNVVIPQQVAWVVENSVVNLPCSAGITAHIWTGLQI